MLFYFWRFQCNSFCDYKRHTTAYPVGLDALEVSAAFYFSLFRGFTVYADGAVTDDKSYFIICGQVLEVDIPVICADLFNVPFHFFWPRNEAVDPQTSPDIVSSKNR
ncbi:Uncharacterised protein [uncultured archaeon]|nr:Uncharacterised protein [uncultured archaeon]